MGGETGFVFGMGVLLVVPFGLCVRVADGFLVGPVCGLSWRVPCPRCAWVPLSECRGGRVVNSERGLSSGQTASVLLKQHAPCIPPRHSARGKSPDSPAKPHTGPTRKHAMRVKAQTALGWDCVYGGCWRGVLFLIFTVSRQRQIYFLGVVVGAKSWRRSRGEERRGEEAGGGCMLSACRFRWMCGCF